MTNQAPSKFKKNPVVIEAIQCNGNNLREVTEFIGRHKSAHDWTYIVKNEGLKILTLEGKMNVDVGDWIIKGVKGEFYHYKPDIFEMTYSPAEQAPSHRIAVIGDTTPQKTLQEAVTLLLAQQAPSATVKVDPLKIAIDETNEMISREIQNTSATVDEKVCKWERLDSGRYYSSCRMYGDVQHVKMWHYCPSCSGRIVVDEALHYHQPTVDDAVKYFIAQHCPIGEDDKRFFMDNLARLLHSQQEKRYTRDEVIKLMARCRAEKSHLSIAIKVAEHILDQFDKEGK